MSRGLTTKELQLEKEALQQLRDKLNTEGGGQKKSITQLDISGSDPEVTAMQFPETQKPMVTREQYERARAVLDSLPSGVYLKCSACNQWQRGGEITFASGNNFFCEGCVN